MSEMQVYTLARTGKRAMEFEGRLLADSVEISDDAPGWWDIMVYETAGGRYVLGYQWMVAAQADAVYAMALAFDDLDVLADYLEGVSPSAVLPETYNVHKMSRIWQTWQMKVADILDRLGVRERVD